MLFTIGGGGGGRAGKPDPIRGRGWYSFSTPGRNQRLGWFRESETETLLTCLKSLCFQSLVSTLGTHVFTITNWWNIFLWLSSFDVFAFIMLFLLPENFGLTLNFYLIFWCLNAHLLLVAGCLLKFYSKYISLMIKAATSNKRFTLCSKCSEEANEQVWIEP